MHISLILLIHRSDLFNAYSSGIVTTHRSGIVNAHTSCIVTVQQKELERQEEKLKQLKRFVECDVRLLYLNI